MYLITQQQYSTKSIRNNSKNTDILLHNVKAKFSVSQELLDSDKENMWPSSACRLKAMKMYLLLNPH